MSAKETQVGGDHYRKYAIQPAEFSHKNGLGFLAGNVVKYVTRYKDKNGAEDIRKAMHYLELILEFEYGETGGTKPAPVAESPGCYPWDDAPDGKDGDVWHAPHGTYVRADGKWWVARL